MENPQARAGRLATLATLAFGDVALDFEAADLAKVNVSMGNKGVPA